MLFIGETKEATDRASGQGVQGTGGQQKRISDREEKSNEVRLASDKFVAGPKPAICFLLWRIVQARFTVDGPLMGRGDSPAVETAGRESVRRSD